MQLNDPQTNYQDINIVIHTLIDQNLENWKNNFLDFQNFKNNFLDFFKSLRHVKTKFITFEGVKKQ